MGSGIIDATDRATAEWLTTNIATLLPAVAQQWRKVPGRFYEARAAAGLRKNTDRFRVASAAM